MLWIIQNIATFNGKVFQEPEIDLFVNFDASLTGWVPPVMVKPQGGVGLFLSLKTISIFWSC